jgi:hypothetical protein
MNNLAFQVISSLLKINEGLGVVVRDCNSNYLGDRRTEIQDWHLTKQNKIEK